VIADNLPSAAARNPLAFTKETTLFASPIEQPDLLAQLLSVGRDQNPLEVVERVMGIEATSPWRNQLVNQRLAITDVAACDSRVSGCQTGGCKSTSAPVLLGIHRKRLCFAGAPSTFRRNKTESSRLGLGA
jgi:hypothetical protein